MELLEQLENGIAPEEEVNIGGELISKVQMPKKFYDIGFLGKDLEHDYDQMISTYVSQNQDEILGQLRENQQTALQLGNLKSRKKTSILKYLSNLSD